MDKEGDKIMYSNYVLGKCCISCSWVETPSQSLLNPSVSRRVCPDCGGDIDTMEGRWQLREVKTTSLGFEVGHSYKFEGFIRKSDTGGAEGE
ncbi:MAG: hypothetical protein ACI9DH_000579 [Halioglobus sp.]|jgi:hypothetical protein